MINCNLCKNKNNFKLIWEKDGFNIVKCLSCGLVQRAVLPKNEDLAHIYSDSYFFKLKDKDGNQGYFNYLADEKFSRSNSRKRLRKINKLKPQGGFLLDVGCAAGFFIDEARRLGWMVEGVEVAKSMIEYANNKLGLKIYPSPFDMIQLNKEYDVISMWDYVEHSLNPNFDIRKAHSLLNDNGLLVLSTGNVNSLVAKASGKNWHLLTPRHHNFYFSKKTIKKLLENNGFSILKIESPGNYYSIEYVVHKLIPHIPTKVLKQIIGKIGESVVGKIGIHLNLFDIMTVYAVKSK